MELSYDFNVTKINFHSFIGITPFNGMYANTLAVVYLGFTGLKQLPLSSEFSLPVSITFATNPKSENYFVTLNINI